MYKFLGGAIITGVVFGILFGQEQGIKKWYGPTLTLTTNQVEVFEDGFSRCYALASKYGNFSADAGDVRTVALSCIPLKGNK